MGEPTETLRAAVARLLCEQHGGDPDAVASEPHDSWDGPLWTAFTGDADKVLALAAAIPPEQDGYAEGVARDREAMVRAMYDAWPHTVISEALSEVFKLPVGTVLTYELARAGGADFKGLERFADAIAAMPATDRHAEGRIAGREEAAKIAEGLDDCGNMGWCGSPDTCTRHGDDLAARIRSTIANRETACASQ